MPVFQIVLDRRVAGSERQGLGLPSERSTLDVLVDGANLTARLERAEVVPLLRDLGRASRDLASGRRRRVTVPCVGGDAAWELGIERSGAGALLSMFRPGPVPEVAVYERRVDGASLLDGTARALEHVLAREPASALTRDLVELASALRASTWPDDAPGAPSLAVVEADAEAPIRFRAEIALREESAEGGADPSLERSDLLSLLFRGSLSITVGDRPRALGEGHVFLVAEALAAIARDVLDAWELGRAYYRRVEACGVLLAARLVPQPGDAGASGLSLTTGGPRTAGLRHAWTFPGLDVPAFAQAALGFGRALVRTLLRRRPDQARNLRLSTFREALRELDERLRDAVRDDGKVNPAPEGYRAFAEIARRPEPDAAPWGRSKMRFAARWTATVPSIDLRATFLCGDRLVVGSARETACLDRASGEVLWRLPSAPALAVVTPAGLARIQGDGVVQVHDFGNGEVVLRARVAPRAGERTSGVVVNAPGLPRLLVIAEAERQLSAIDLGSGEIRWRHSARRAETFRIRRAGRLLVVASGDLALTALDVATGELVWRVRDRLRFASPPSLDGDSLFAIAGEVGSSARVVARLHHLDAWAGTTRWARELPAGTAPNGAPLVAGDVVVVVTRDRRGLGLLALDRSTGETRWSVDPGWAPVRSAWLAVDDAIVCNTEHGAMSALDARNGATLWRHVLARGVEGDQPRKLEPVLRSGALFLPQSAVHVIRPRDGALLGTVPSDIIPDLMRVDERCDVYVAEESGHLAAYSAGARLTLVSAG